MNLDTYRSTVDAAVFVTVPSVSAEATIALLDELSVLRLDPVRRAYRLPDDDAGAPFARFVLTEIVRKGYARHGADGPF